MNNCLFYWVDAPSTIEVFKNLDWLAIYNIDGVDTIFRSKYRAYLERYAEGHIQDSYYLSCEIKE